jgi:hypothetical protein
MVNDWTRFTAPEAQQLSVKPQYGVVTKRYNTRGPVDLESQLRLQPLSCDIDRRHGSNRHLEDGLDKFDNPVEWLLTPAIEHVITVERSDPSGLVEQL